MIFDQEFELQPLKQSPKSIKAIQKISKFIQTQNITINQFWQTSRNYASLQDINLFCQIIGLKLTAQDTINIKSELFFCSQVVSLYDFCQLIPFWKNDPNGVIGDFLKQRSDNLLEGLNGKRSLSKTSKKSIRPFSSNPIKRNISNSKQNNKALIPNNSKKYLQSYKQRKKQKQEELAEAIERTKNQYEYSMLIKMNEINEINKKNRSSITYRAYKNAEGNINVRVFDYETLKKEITLKQFESQYKVFMKSCKQNKQWERKSIPKSNPLDMGKVNNMGLNRKNQKKQQRQKQLKNLLENTVKLTQILQEQIKIFKARGIYGTENYDL